MRGSSGFQRVGGSKSGAPSREEGGAIVIRGRAGSTMLGDGERFCPGENEGQEEGLYSDSKNPFSVCLKHSVRSVTQSWVGILLHSGGAKCSIYPWL